VFAAADRADLCTACLQTDRSLRASADLSSADAAGDGASLRTTGRLFVAFRVWTLWDGLLHRSTSRSQRLRLRFEVPMRKENLLLRGAYVLLHSIRVLLRAVCLLCRQPLQLRGQNVQLFANLPMCGSQLPLCRRPLWLHGFAISRLHYSRFHKSLPKGSVRIF
jgi:hypothetical protein